MRKGHTTHPKQLAAADLPITGKGKHVAKLIMGNSMGRALLAAVGISEKNVLQVALDMGRDTMTSLVITRALEVDDVAKLSDELQRIINAAEIRERIWTADQCSQSGNAELRERLREGTTAPAGTAP